MSDRISVKRYTYVISLYLPSWGGDVHVTKRGVHVAKGDVHVTILLIKDNEDRYLYLKTHLLKLFKNVQDYVSNKLIYTQYEMILLI